MNLKKFILPALLFSSLNIFAQINTPDYVPANGLVGWWPFNGNANDNSGKGNNGAVTSAALSVDRFGNPNAAYLFNGADSRIDVADAASLRCRKLTLSAWVKTKDTLKTYQVIYKGSMYADGEVYALTVDEGGEPYSAAKFGSNCATAIGWLGPGKGTAIDTGSWTHVVSTYDGTTTKIYKNGVLENSSTITGLIDSCIGGGLRFGFDHLRWSVSTGDPFNGYIDDIGIWNRALDETEISHLYSGTADCGNGKMGVNVCDPQRSLHVKDVLRLEPRDTAPDNPGKGDIYFDGTLNKLRVYDGTVWQNCW